MTKTELQSDWDAKIPFPWTKLFVHIHLRPFPSQEVGSGHDTKTKEVGSATSQCHVTYKRRTNN